MDRYLYVDYTGQSADLPLDGLDTGAARHPVDAQGHGAQAVSVRHASSLGHTNEQDT